MRKINKVYQILTLMHGSLLTNVALCNAEATKNVKSIRALQSNAVGRHHNSQSTQKHMTQQMMKA